MDSLFSGEMAFSGEMTALDDAPMSGVASDDGIDRHATPGGEKVFEPLPLDPRFTAPALSDAPSAMRRYIAAVHAIPMLSADEEVDLIRRWIERREPEAGRRLIASHLRLVVAIALTFCGRRRLEAEVIQQGNIGLVRALDGFDPGQQARLSTYAAWWIRSGISDYVLRSWSIVRVGTNAKEKRLFFNLRRFKRALADEETGELSAEATRTIAERLNVRDADVTQMNGRLFGPDLSLQTAVVDESDTTFQDNLVDPDSSPEAAYAEAEEHEHRRRHLRQAMLCLGKRERIVVEARHLQEKPATLGELSERLGISLERVRQIDGAAVRKLRMAICASVSGRQRIGQAARRSPAAAPRRAEADAVARQREQVSTSVPA